MDYGDGDLDYEDGFLVDVVCLIDIMRGLPVNIGTHVIVVFILGSRSFVD